MTEDGCIKDGASCQWIPNDLADSVFNWYNGKKNNLRPDLRWAQY